MPSELRVSRTISSAFARQWKLSTVAYLCTALWCFCFLVRSSSAQTSQLVPLVTDQTPMGLSAKFGVPAGRVVNQSGDYAFVGEGGTAIFFLSHTAASGATPTRVLQFGDEVPGFSGSRITNFASLQLNDSGHMAFQARANLSTGQGLQLILSYDGTSFQDLVDSTMPAPGQGGATYLSFSLLGLDNAGDFAFLANTTATPPTVYIAMSGSSPTVVARTGDPAPGTAGTFRGFDTGNFVSAALNNSGQLMMTCDISGGAGGTGFFVFSTAGIRKVVANGDANPLGGLFTISPQTAWGVFNNQGQVAFIAGNPAGAPAGNSLFINSPTSATAGTTAVVSGAGSAAPASLGGTMSFVQTLPPAIAFWQGWLGLNDNGDIIAVATLSGSAVTNQALLRFTATPANSTTYTTGIVANVNQAAPGVPGETFSFLQNASINNSGLVTFASQLRNTNPPGLGTVVGGLFEQAASGAVSKVVLDGDAVSGLAGGGNFLVYVVNQSGGLGIAVLPTVTLNNGTIFFTSDVAGGAADHGEFSWSGGVLRILMNTNQALPAGTNVAMAQPQGAGNYVAYIARYAGGQANLVVHNIVTQATQVAAYEGMPATGTPAVIKVLNGFHVNSLGHLAFQAGLTGNGTGGTGIFVAVPGTGISKISVAGEIDAATSNGVFEQVLPSGFPGSGFSPFNDGDQVAFTALDGVPGAILVGAPGVAPVVVVTQNYPSLNGLPLFQKASISLNNHGVLAFLNVPPGTQTVTSTGSTLTPEAIFVATPSGSTPPYNLDQIVRTGDGSGAGQFTILNYPSLNNLGALAVGAGLTGGSATAGIFVGDASGGGALALDGTPAPAGGNFSIPTPSFAEINDQNDVTFASPLTGGTASAGVFVRRGATISGANPLGVLTAPVLAGQPAPGSPGTFATFNFGTPPILGPTGDIAFQATYSTGGPNIGGLWHIASNDTVEPIIVQGTVSPEFGGGTLVTSLQGFSWNNGTTPGLGQFPVFGMVSGGTFLDGIFLFEPGIPTNTPAGTNVNVSPTDATTGTSPVSLTFGDVTTAGTTSLTIASGGPTLPTGFELGNPPVFYNLSTTAVFAGSVTVCIDTSGVSFSGPQNLRLIHFTGAAWTDITTSVNGSVVCGTTTSFSPFAVANLSQVAVPNVVGQSQAAATTAITAAGLTVGTVTTSSSTTVPSGSVISEIPSAGALVNQGSAVNLVVSSGPPQVKVVLAATNPYTIVEAGGGYSLTVTLVNNGNVSIDQLNLSRATLAGVGALAFPNGTAAYNLAPGARATFAATFSSAVGAPGKSVPLSIGGTYAAGALSGNWSASVRSVTLP